MDKNKKDGFSLVELSIVLIILALLAGGILAGRNLIHAAEVNGTMADIEHYTTSYQAFRLKYDCIPGDCHNAADYFPSFSPVIENGDGSGLINCEAGADPSCDAPTNENVMAIRSLAAAGLISGDVDTQNGFAKAKLGECQMQFYRESLYANPERNVLRVYRPLTAAPWNEDCMTPEEAESIDRKMDDGNPSSGKIFGVRAEGSPQTPCVNVDRWVPPSSAGAYNVANGDIECSIYAGVANF